MDQELPVIKASAMAIAFQGANANPETGNFVNINHYIENFVKSKIKNQSINEPGVKREIAGSLGKLKTAMSFMALALSPL